MTDCGHKSLQFGCVTCINKRGKLYNNELDFLFYRLKHELGNMLETIENTCNNINLVAEDLDTYKCTMDDAGMGRTHRNMCDVVLSSKDKMDSAYNNLEAYQDVFDNIRIKINDEIERIHDKDFINEAKSI